MNMSDVEKLKVGDRVGFAQHGNWGDVYNAGFGTITKIDGREHRHVQREVEGQPLKFTKRGDEVGVHRGLELFDANELEERVKADTESREYGAKLRAFGDAAEQAVKTHRGGFHGRVELLSKEEKDSLAALLAAL